MIKLKSIFLVSLVSVSGAFFSASSYAVEPSSSNVQELQLVDSEIDVLQLKAVDEQALGAVSEVRQEATVGRAGLQGTCAGAPKTPPLSQQR